MTPRRRAASVLTSRGAMTAAARMRRAGRTIVFTSGCFDLIHRGHVALLDRARGLGDLLIVGVHSDRSVRRLKGVGRPITPLSERMEILAGLRMVDCVVSFDGLTPARLIARLHPDVLVKGEGAGHDRNPGLVGRQPAGKGGRVVIVPRRRGDSTAQLIRRASAWTRRRRDGGRRKGNTR